ncbi:MAG TPA: ABC transporter permease [Bryobacteraceae bacterium]|nr:ABC transporter permease [Bryobacteraceae bacterium]
MWRRIYEILRKEFRQVLREPRMRGMLIGPPIIQLLIFGYAVNLDVENSRIAWMDQDRTPQSRELLAGFQGSRHFRVVATPASDGELQQLLDHGRVQLAVRVLPGFGRDIQRGRTAQVQILVDGTNSNTASIAASQAGALVSAYGSKVMAAQMNQRLVGRTMAAGGPVNLEVPVLTFRSRAWFNPDLRSRNYFVPGVVVNIITLITLMMTAMGIVREKEIGTMEQLMVTPIRPVELILGKTLPFALVGLLDVLLVTGVAMLVFQIPLRGSVLLLLFSSVLFLMTTLGAGLFISTICGTQQQAMMSSFFFFNPAFMLSGFTFPIRNMPEVVQYLTYLNPLRYFIEIVRGIFLKGSGISTLWPQMLALFIFGLAILTGSVLRFHKRLD